MMRACNIRCACVLFILIATAAVLMFLEHRKHSFHQTSCPLISHTAKVNYKCQLVSFSCDTSDATALNHSYIPPCGSFHSSSLPDSASSPASSAYDIKGLSYLPQQKNYMDLRADQSAESESEMPVSTKRQLCKTGEYGMCHTLTMPGLPTAILRCFPDVSLTLSFETGALHSNNQNVSSNITDVFTENRYYCSGADAEQCLETIETASRTHRLFTCWYKIDTAATDGTSTPIFSTQSPVDDVSSLEFATLAAVVVLALMVCFFNPSTVQQYHIDETSPLLG